MHLDILFSFGLLALSSAAPTGGSGTKSALLASTVSPTYLNPTIATAEPTSKPGQKLPPLLPAIHWDHAGSKLEHLAPQSEHALYFSSHGVSDPRLQHAFSHFNATWQKHVVILDHSTLIQSVECSVGGIAIEFTSNTAYEYAKKAWPSDSDFMLATYTDGCGQLEDHVRSFWKVDDLTYLPNELTILADVREELGMESVLEGASMEWGTWRPSRLQTKPNVVRRKRTTSQCGAAPGNKIDGFPTAACDDPNFDETLDNEIGYLDCQAKDYSECFKKFVPGASNDTDPDPDLPNAPDLNNRLQYHVRSALSRRRVKRNIFDGIGQIMKGGFEQFGGALSGNAELIKQGGKNIDEGKSKLVIEPNVDFDLPINVAPPPDKLKQEPWPNSLPIHKFEGEAGGVKGTLEVFCVNCHFTGKIEFAGSAEWHLTEGLKKCQANIKGNAEAQLAIGLVAEATREDKFEIEIARLNPPLVSFQIPKIIEIGPFIALRATAESKVTLKGQVLAGAKLTIPPFEGNLDLVDASKSKPLELKPELEPIFEAKAEISVTAGLGLPVAIGLGISIPPIKFKKDAEFVEKPMIEAAIKAEIATDGTPTSSPCKGIDWSIFFKNTVYLNAFDIKQFTINEFKKDIKKGCLEIPGLGSRTTSGDAAKRNLNARNPTTTSLAVSPASPISTASASNGLTSANRNATWLPYHKKNYAFIENNANDFTEYEKTTQFANLANKALGHQSNDTVDPFQQDDKFIQIKSVDGQVQLTLDNDGNMRPYSAEYKALRWTESEGLVFAGENSRILHYYPDTMTKLGVSRIRGSEYDKIPKTADLVVLHPAATGNQKVPYLYEAADSLGNVFQLVTCNYNKGPSKLFLAKDLDKGIETLKQVDLRYIVTGGIVEECIGYPWVVPAGAQGNE